MSTETIAIGFGIAVETPLIARVMELHAEWKGKARSAIRLLVSVRTLRFVPVILTSASKW